MYYIYSIQSETTPSKYYVGLTTDIKRRLDEHNAGKSIHTNKFRPWNLVSYSVSILLSKKAFKVQKILA